MLLNTLHAALDQITYIAKLFCVPNTDSQSTGLTIAELEALYVERGVGPHIRHVSDHIHAFLDGVANSEIDYNFRTRNSETERDAAHALQLVQSQQAKLLQVQESAIAHSVRVHSEIGFEQSQSGYFQSSIAREMLYLINHTIHHAAYVKLNLRHAGIALPAHIGLAPCTLTFARQSQVCAA